MAKLAVGQRPDATTLGRSAVGLVATSICLFLVDALLGPSAASPNLPGTGPTRDFGVRPPTLLASGLLWAAIAVGALAVFLGWWALTRGWSPSARRLRNGGIVAAVAMAAVPPLGSSDILSYAVYGRLAALGLNPYANTVQDLLARHDAVGQAYVGPWDHVASVYGPVGTGSQLLVSWLAGDSVRLFALGSQLLELGVFVGLIVLLERFVGSDDSGRRRVSVLFSTNPLLLFMIVNSAHIDGLAVLCGLAALLTLRRSPAAAGVFVGLAVGTKVTLVLYAVAMLWALRGSRRDLIRFVAAAVATGLVLFVPFLPEVLRPLGQASQYTARQSPWHLALGPLRWFLDEVTIHRLFAVGVWLLVAAVTWRLSSVLPRRSGPRDFASEAVWASGLLSLAWLLSSTYALAWYDVIAWVPMVLLPATRIDLVLLARTAVVAFVYVPGLFFAETGAFAFVTINLSSSVAPVVGLGLLLVVLFGGNRLLLQPPAARTG